jgi:rhamnulokinase
MNTFAAVDLGASSGRVMVGGVEPGKLTLDQAARFPNEPVRVGGTLHWDILALYRGVLEGLRAAGPVRSIGIDSWAVDYGLLDASGALLGNPVHYRDARTDGVPARVAERIPEYRLYALTGLQKQPFNTLYQLVAAAGTPAMEVAQRLLMIPDLIAYWLTGELGAEFTNASTTQLIDLRTGGWALPLMAELGIRPDLFPALRAPGTVIGPGGGRPPPPPASITRPTPRSRRARPPAAGEAADPARRRAAPAAAAAPSRTRRVPRPGARSGPTQSSAG